MKKFYFLLLALGLFGGVNAQVVNIPDANFKAKLLAANTTNSIAQDLLYNSIKIDINNDGQIQNTEALSVYRLNVGNPNPNTAITSLSGIESFLNLRQLNCGYNQISSLDVTSLTNLEYLICTSYALTSLNVTGLSNLKGLGCGLNHLSSLDLTGLTSLESLGCKGNNLSSLNLTGLTNLWSLDCSDNNLSNLNLSGLTNLWSVYCEENNIYNLNLSGLTNLRVLQCGYNLIPSLNLSDSVNLEDLKCNNNLLTSLDVSHLTKLNSLTCSTNYLSTLFTKNGRIENPLNFNNNPNLQYICADENQLENIQYSIIDYGLTNCHANSYCTFNPGGSFYTINGEIKFDSNNNNDCDINDELLPNLKFNIIDATNLDSYVSNVTGNYSIPLITGTHTITPAFENPSYFTISPATVNVTFPTQASPFTQNFCVKANGVHPDLEITLLPLSVARPGFDAKYKLIYKNKGNTTQSGTVNLVFNDAVLDLVSANPATTTQVVNNLSWNFVNLLPFETREITITLNVNSPMEIPAVNGGDVLNYATSITSVATDDLPNDNSFTFPQTVVNSFDPNDKTCLEGIKIAPEKVGEYVHYIIRFENNGTANAQNIVVKDMIDLAKFDIASLVPMKGSHSYVTNITAGNKVEFIFENINLPFDDANNDGYVAFKIKTKPTLVLGNTFSNTSSIYFDYNFPIVTNTATTTIAALSTQDFEFSNYFSLYPNPVSNILNISAKENIEISSINIYNTLGQLVLVIPNAKDMKTVDVSGLTSGHYFIKVHSDKGTSNTKFIKN